MLAHHVAEYQCPDTRRRTRIYDHTHPGHPLLDVTRPGMGGRQSSSPASDGRTRAYSGSDIPSSTGRGPIRGPAGVAASTSSPLNRYPYISAAHTAGAAGGSEHTPPALNARSRSVGGIRGQAPLSQAGLNIPGAARDSGNSTPEEGGRDRAPGGGSRLLIGSLPSHLSPHLFGGE